MAPRVASSAGPRLLRVEQLTLYSAPWGFTEARFVDVSTSPGHRVKTTLVHARGHPPAMYLFPSVSAGRHSREHDPGLVLLLPWVNEDSRRNFRTWET